MNYHAFGFLLISITVPPVVHAAETRVVQDLGITLVHVPAGLFTMGRPAGYPGSSRDERPETRVRIAKPFWLGATEVTVGQWRRFVEATHFVTAAEKNGAMWNWIGPGSIYEKPPGTSWKNPGRIKQDDRHPVVGVSWDDAMAFCAWLTERERVAGRLPAGHVYTLPTEAQWEYAARSGSSGPEPENIDEFAWHSGNSGKNTQPVGTKKPNAFGLYDMIGNVWEWCLDWYGPYPGGDVTDFQGRKSEPPLERFPAIHNNRGNGFNGDPGHATSSTNRWDRAGQDERDTLGFRLALSPVQ